jgi:hypothetical protein
MRMTLPFVALAAMALMALASSQAVLGQGIGGGVPEVTPQPVQANAGDSLDLEVSVLAHANGTYRATFDARQWFSFPGLAFVEYRMSDGDSIIFKVRCKVDSSTPNGEFPVMFNLTWTAGNATHNLPGTVKVTVGQGTGKSSCTSAIVVGCASVTALVAAVGRRRQRR